jgi:hypothetical protein
MTNLAQTNRHLYELFKEHLQKRYPLAVMSRKPSTLSDETLGLRFEVYYRLKRIGRRNKLVLCIARDYHGHNLGQRMMGAVGRLERNALLNLSKETNND